VVRLQVPPLRERRDDVPLLTERFLALAAQRLRAAPKRLLPEAVARLRAREWPGNVRELENACWRLAALAADDRIAAADVDALVPASAAGTAAGEEASGPAGTHAADPERWDAALAAWARARLDAGEGDLHAQARDLFEQALFDAALDHTGGHRGEAAARLGLGRNTLTRRLGPGRKRR
jgi:two-component system nitrogen regulation response regulator GlnG